MEGPIDTTETLYDISQIKSSDLRKEAMEALVQGLAKRLVRLQEYAVRMAERGSIPSREVIANIMADKP